MTRPEVTLIELLAPKVSSCLYSNRTGTYLKQQLAVIVLGK